jgi:hypothetical protein
MTTMTFSSATTEPGDNPYNAGYSDGEIAAISKLPARRAIARAAMADEYDPLWAQGYADGYLDEIARNAALNQPQDSEASR